MDYSRMLWRFSEKHYLESGADSLGEVMAGATIAAVPMIIIFLFFQQYFLKGITIGAVKG